MKEQPGGRDLPFAEALLDQLQRRDRAVVHRDDRVVLHEDRKLAVKDHVGARLLERVHDDVVVIVVFIDLRPLVLMLGVLDRERMKIQLA